MWRRASAGHSVYSTPMVAWVARSRPSIEGLAAGDARGGEPVRQCTRGPPVGRLHRELAHHDARDARAVGLDVVRIDAVVADHRRRHHDDLAEIRRVGEDFLIPGEISREDDLGIRGLERHRRGAGEPRAVFEQHVGGVTVSDGAEDSGWKVSPAAYSAVPELPGAAAVWVAPGRARARLLRAPSAGPRCAPT